MNLVDFIAVLKDLQKTVKFLRLDDAGEILNGLWAECASTAYFNEIRIIN